jgi:hypothetical protein
VHLNCGIYWKCSQRGEEKEVQVSFGDVCPEQNYLGSNNQLMKEEKNKK